MPTGNFSRIDLDLLEPEFLATLLDVIAACNERGFEYHATSGWRSYGAQMALWAKGRTAPGPVVTHAKGGQSSHCFGIAVDFVLDQSKAPGIQPDWRPEAYEVLIEEVQKRGLHSGVGYKDAPHVSLTGYITATDLLPLHLEWEKSADVTSDTLVRLKKVWKAIPKGG